MPKTLKPENFKKVKLLLFDSYLRTIENSLGARSFRNLFACADGIKKDIADNGRLSCAWFVSSILYLYKLTTDLHATINGTIKDLEKSGWQIINQPRPGAVIVWSAKKYRDGSIHKHIGFYLKNGRAVSNGTAKRTPILHHWTFGARQNQPVRPVEKIYWHKKLNKKWTTY